MVFVMHSIDYLLQSSATCQSTGLQTKRNSNFVSRRSLVHEQGIGVLPFKGSLLDLLQVVSRVPIWGHIKLFKYLFLS